MHDYFEQGGGGYYSKGTDRAQGCTDRWMRFILGSNKKDKT